MAIDIKQAYAVYGPMVLRRCSGLLGSSEEGRDLMQDVFVQLLRHQGELQDTHLASLLWTISTRLCLNRLRQRRARGTPLGDSTLDTIVAAIDDTPRFEAWHALQSLLKRVPVSTAAMAVMHWVDGMTHEEVAQAVGMSVSGVRRRLRVLQGLFNQAEAASYD